MNWPVMLKPNPHLPAVLIILDGWGLRNEKTGNAIRQAVTPTMERLWRDYPHSVLEASGAAVGLPEHQAGNSEAGHLNIGAGRIVEQDAVRITRSINDGRFFKNPAFIEAVHHVKKHHSRLHLMGMISGDQSPHVDPGHVSALITLARQRHVQSVVLHLFTDGRDSSPHAGLSLVTTLEQTLDPGREIIGTIAGRLYMDRKKDWARTEQIYRAMVDGRRANTALSVEAAISRAYTQEKTDEFIEPTVIKHKGRRAPRIASNDAVILFNLRSDRARQLAKPFAQKEFAKKNPGAFAPSPRLTNLVFVAMTDFGPDLEDILTAYPSKDLTDTLPMALASSRQLYIAETEKYAHITFFLNGGYSHPVAGETRLLVPSPDVSHYDTVPAMAAEMITETVTSAIKANRFDFIALNFANADMVGHSGNIAAAIQAISTVDRCIGEIVKSVTDQGGIACVCADHGNAETMIDLQSGKISTQHSRAPVPFIMVMPTTKKLQRAGSLAHVAPTLLEGMGVPVPAGMTGGGLWQ